MTPRDKSSDRIARSAEPWASAPSGMAAPVDTLPENARRRIELVGIAATGVAATIWSLGVVWAWRVIG